MLHVEFHCHSAYSKDSLTTPHKLIVTCRKKGLDRVVITDHNTIEGALRAKEIDPERVIIGEEIMTSSGELLAAFMNEAVPPGLSPEETIQRLRGQGAFISVSHPFDRPREGSWREKDLIGILHLVDAIEIFNSRCMWPGFNQRAQEFAREYSLLGTVGSDAHTSFELGRATFWIADFRDASEFKVNLRSADMRLHLSPPWIHLTSRYATWRKKLTRIITRF